MLDHDLAKLYHVKTRIINQSVKRNILRFPSSYCFQMTENEFTNWKSQIVISNSDKMGLRKKPFVFNEQGVAMLSAVLRSETAIKVSLLIMDSFVKMRQLMQNNSHLINRLDFLETKQIKNTIQIEKIFNLIDQNNPTPQQGVFFRGQIFDAYKFAVDVITSAKTSIDIIDNYVDEKVYDILNKRKNGVEASIYTMKFNLESKKALAINELQYPKINIFQTQDFHDRFIIIDLNKIYHIGASIKDLGKKCFAFSQLEISSLFLIKSLLEKSIQIN
jgi:hypothetical protein